MGQVHEGHQVKVKVTGANTHKKSPVPQCKTSISNLRLYNTETLSLRVVWGFPLW